MLIVIIYLQTLKTFKNPLLSFVGRTDLHEKMLAQIFLTLIFIPSCLLSNTPYTPKEYQKIIKQGFSTNWFKTEDPLSKYNETNIEDVYAKGFRNLRIRCDSEFSKGSYTTQEFKSFLKQLACVVDKCLKVLLLVYNLSFFKNN